VTFAHALYWIHGSEFSRGIRESGFFYPLIEGTHVLSLSMSVGLILWFDLRLTGITLLGESISRFYASLRPWLIIGFSLMATSGLLLFIAHASDAWASTYFRIKLVLLSLCLTNILTYHLLVGKSTAGWDTGVKPPTSARLAGGLSMLLWFSVIAVGRIMAYNL
jgi:hypothetical protein